MYDTICCKKLVDIMSMIIDEQRFFDTLHKMFNVEIAGVDIKDMHFTRKYAFTLKMQHLRSKINKKILCLKLESKKGSSRKKQEMKVYKNMTQLNKQKYRKLGGNLIALKRREK